MSKYNGWTNYATWRVNLEMFDSVTVLEFCGRPATDVGELADEIKSFAEEIIDQGSQEGYARSYAFAFLSEVNWYEIAEHMIKDYERNQEAA
jgi:dTDP-4-dehydrorhamnose reductase